MYRLFYVLICLFCSQAIAFDGTSRYESSAPVQSQAEQERLAVLPDLLSQVILKVVGNSDLLSKHDLSPVLQQSAELVKQFQYRRKVPISEDLTEPDRLELVVLFDEARLNQALTKQDLPIWQGVRPQVLAWLAIQQNQGAIVLGDEHNQQSVYQALQTAAQQRGISVMTPVMDLQDQQAVSALDIKNMTVEKIINASNRYGNKVIVIANVQSLAQDEVEIQWQWLINNQSQHFRSQQTTELAIRQGIDKLTNELASQLSRVMSMNSASAYTLTVENVSNFSDYTRLLNYLSNLHNVTAVKVLSLVESTLEVSVDLKGDTDLFNRTVLFEQVIEKVSGIEESSMMRYRLLP
jgi:hypothetical protein